MGTTVVDRKPGLAEDAIFGVALNCGSCGRRLSRVRGDEFCVYTDTTYPRVNATTILGTPETVAGMTCWAQASVGRCPDCKERHWFLSVCLSQCDDDALMDIVLYNPPSSSSHLEPPRGTDPPGSPRCSMMKPGNRAIATSLVP